MQPDRVEPAEPNVRKVFASDREDGRLVDTAGFMQAYINGTSTSNMPMSTLRTIVSTPNTLCPGLSGCLG